MNVEGDRLSSLPDDLIHKILSFIGIKHAIQASVLSSRWRFIWTTMPYLNFSTDDCYRLPKLKFITHVLASRNNQIEVSNVKLSFHGDDIDVIVKHIMEYAVSHNIQQLNVACLFEGHKVEFPPFLSSSRSLKHLSVTKEDFSATPYRRQHSFPYAIKATTTWDFPALTTLHLHNVNLCRDEKTDKCIGFFSECANLTNLTLKGCSTIGFKGLSICLPLLSNLTLDNIRGNVTVFNIVAPQLKNLTISSFSPLGYQPIPDHQYLLSAPNLVFLCYNGYNCMQLSTDGFLSLEKADICVSSPKDAHQVLRLLQQFHNVKSLTLNLEIVERLTSSMDLMSHQPSPFANLKSLKVHPASEYSEVQKRNRGKMSAEVKSYLLDGSPGAIVTMVSREDIRVKKITRMAQNLTTKLTTLLEEERSNMETIMAEIYEQRKSQDDEFVVADWYIHSRWNYLSMQIEKREENPSGIISKLTEIKELLGKLPASNRDTIQPSFTTLCADADVVIGKMTDFVKLHFDENRRRLSVCCHELATTFKPSS